MFKVKNMESSWKVKYPNKNIYLMRDHNWAFSAWEISRLKGEITSGARLLHIDFHDDYLEPGIEIGQIRTEEDALLIGKQLHIAEFIKAAESTGTIKDVYMIGDYSMPTQKNVIHSYTYYQFENNHRLNFFNPENQSFILDLDLDFFNLHSHNSISAYGDNPYLYSDEYIKKQLERLKQYYTSWDVITVCISPEHCGGTQPAQHLLNLFIEVFNLEKEYYCEW